MNVKLSKINIKAFRGIPDLELDLDGKSLIIKGENGSGKSSIVDAIELFFTGKVLYLDGVRGLSLHNHGTHVNYKPENVKISLTFNPGNITMIRTFNSSFSIPLELEPFFKITNNGTFILRRSQLLEFISSQPAERFRAIGSIIGIEALDELELEMKRLRDELEGNVNSKSGQIKGLYHEISDILGKEVTDQSKILKALNELLKNVDLPPIESLDEAAVHAERMLKSIKKTDQLDKIKTLNELLELTKEPFGSESLFAELSSLNDKIKPLLNRNADLSLKSLLELGSKIILEKNLTRCPLCENEIDPENLLMNIQEREDILIKLSDDASKIITISVPLISTLEEIDSKIELLESNAAYFEPLADETIILHEKGPIFRGLIDNTKSAISLSCEIPLSEISNVINIINVSLINIPCKGKVLLDLIDLTVEEKRVLEIARLIDQIRSKSADISRITDELHSYQAYHSASKKIYNEFSDAKKAKIQEVYDIIGEDIRRFYSFLHPGEPHKNIELIVATGRRASTELKIESFGRKGEDPRALTSEGHLDSLGLCIFLAFVKKFNQDCSLIILDDVVTTVDSRHRNHICKLLIKEFQEKQMIVTTHDNLWYEQLQAHQRAYRVEGNFKNLVIASWDMSSGPNIRPYKPRWEKIQEKISSSDKAGAGNAGRQYLEWLLETICETTMTPVPFKKSGRYEIRDLLDSAKKRLFDDLLIDDDFKSKMEEAFRHLECNIFLANILSHNNPLSEEASIDEVGLFCEAVHDIHNLFLCTNCGQILKYYRDMKLLRCSKPRCQDHLEIRTK